MSHQPDKPHLVLIGSGWASFYIAEKIDYNKYNVTMISPRRTSTYTPLLASAATGLFSFSLAEEPVRHKRRRNLKFRKANVTHIDFDNENVTCLPAFEDDLTLMTEEFQVAYDILVIAPGCRPNTFDIPGADKYAIFVKSVSDAMAIRKRLLDLLEWASLPTVSRERASELLHIAIVGGGPTGVELTAELSDMANHELRDIYPDVSKLIKISVYDVAPNILGNYDKSLHEYATQQLEKRNINVSPNTRIEQVDENALHIKDKGRVPYGMLLWATGNKNVALIDEIRDHISLPSKGLQRIQTDSHLRVYKSQNDQLHDSVYALGDAADIPDHPLPTTAEVAVQKAKYLVEQLNNLGDHMAEPFSRPFAYSNKAMVSYIGSQDGVITGQDGKDGAGAWTGRSAWLAWRRGTLYWNRSWRSRILICITWVFNSWFGKEIAKL